MTAIATEAVVADTITIARIPAPTGGEAARAAWLQRRLDDAPGQLSQDAVGNLVWRLGEPPYELALLTHLDTVFDESVDHDAYEQDGWLHGPGIGDNSLALAVTVAVVERLNAGMRGSLVTVFTVGEEGLGALRGAKHACETLRPRQVIALEGHGLDTVYTDAVGSVRARLEVTGPGGHSWWDKDRPSAVHGLRSTSCSTAHLRTCR
ncbi:MAG: M20/M25/M40 family metallo-hydrolase [Streptosporangiales bacterium]|nr:M20/M25/M40 family metallo-hydrolase [Streptosporangiales bacterium]